MEEYELTKAHRAIQDFTINELSNWYIRRNRRRFWKGENDDEKIAAYQTLIFVLKNITVLMSSLAPFFSEELFQRLRNDNDPESVHLSDFPNIDESKIDSDLELKMSIVQKIVYLTRSLREKAKIRTRQPLRRILIPIDSPQTRRNILEFSDIIQEELNIREIEFIDESNSDVIKRKAKANFKVMGKKFGKLMKLAAEAISSLSNEKIIEFEKTGNLSLIYQGESLEFVSEDLEIFSEDIEGWLVARDNDLTVALDTTLDSNLIQEGIAREFVNRIQNLRKDNGFEVTDRIEIQYFASEAIVGAINSKLDYIMNETLAVSVNYIGISDNLEEIDFLEEKINIFVKKV
jgi:isoleucyl-tRNA synthetase